MTDGRLVDSFAFLMILQKHCCVNVTSKNGSVCRSVEEEEEEKEEEEEVLRPFLGKSINLPEEGREGGWKGLGGGGGKLKQWRRS